MLAIAKGIIYLQIKRTALFKIMTNVFGTKKNNISLYYKSKRACMHAIEYLIYNILN